MPVKRSEYRLQKTAEAVPVAPVAKAGERGPRGPAGEDGLDGPMGPMPRHQWKGTALRFEQAPGEWGKTVDLKGEPGPAGGGGGVVTIQGSGGAVSQIEFSATVSFASSAEMPTRNVAEQIDFEPDDTGARPGATVSVDLIADGVNEPTFDGFREVESSDGWDNTLGVRNLVTFFWRAGRPYVHIGHELGRPDESPAPEAEFVRLTNLTNLTESGNGTVGWSYSVATPGSFIPKGRFDKHFDVGTGSAEFTIQGQGCFGLAADPAEAASVFTCDLGIWWHDDFTLSKAQNSSFPDTGFTWQAGDTLRCTRSGSTLIWERGRSGSWVTIGTDSDVPAVVLYAGVNLDTTGEANVITHTGLVA